MLECPIDYDDINHIYSRKSDGLIIPGASTVVKEVKRPYDGLPRISQDSLEYAGQLGKYVHKACELDLIGELDINTVQGPVLGRFKAWENARKKLNIRPICVEKMVWNLDIGLVGRLDIRALIDLGETQKDVMATLDIKTSNKEWEHFKWQCGLYSVGWWSITDKKWDGMCEWVLNGHKLWLPKDHTKEKIVILYLHIDGKFFLDVYPKKDDEPYQVQEESVAILDKYWAMNGGYIKEDGTRSYPKIINPVVLKVSKKRGRPPGSGKKKGTPDYGLF